jgi:protein-tyrosine-phosphatase
MADGVYNVLFICTANAARSIMAEAILNREGAGRFRAYSAGSHPAGSVNVHALTLLNALGYETVTLRSKSWDEFAAPGAPEMDFIFTVCDDAAGETCPVWPGHPATTHWGVPDPAKADGGAAEIAEAFDEAYRLLAARIGLLVALPIAKLDRAALHKHLVDIGNHGQQSAA